MKIKFKSKVIYRKNLFSSRSESAWYVILPDGDIIGWKKCMSEPNGSGDEVIVQLLIPAGARRLNVYGVRKCRAEYAKVLNVEYTGEHTLVDAETPESIRRRLSSYLVNSEST